MNNKMDKSKKKFKLVLILIIIIMAFIILFIPKFISIVKAVTPGYHLVYHNGGNWTNYGQTISNCDNLTQDQKGRNCYHYLYMDIITLRLYNGNSIQSVTLPTSDGGTWTVSGEYLWGYYDSSMTFRVSPTPVGSMRAEKDVRVYKFKSSIPDCDKDINGKYLKGVMYYKWQFDNEYGFTNVNYPGKSGGTAYSVNYDGGTYYHYFLGYNNLSGEGLNARGYYPTFDCAINGKKSRGLVGYDSSGNEIWNNSATEGYVWNSHTHYVYRYKCNGHEEPNKYTVTYNANGGTGTTNPTNHTYDVESNLATNEFTKPGCTFEGWTDGTNIYTDGQPVINLTTEDGGNITLDAIWSNNDYTLNINPNGGTWEGSTAEKNFTISYSETKTIENPTRYGYSFEGWELTGEGSSLNEKEFTMGYENATLTATWNLITHNISGKVIWIDENDKYLARPNNVQVTLSRTPTTGAITPIPEPVLVEGNGTFDYNNLQTYDTTTGNAYEYSVSQNEVSGYKTTINGYVIKNELIVPSYSSSITYTPVNTYEDKYLKNGKVKINANVENTSINTYEELGLNNGIVTFKIDEAIKLDTNTLKIYYTDNSGEKKEVEQYKLDKNNLTIDFGENRISKLRDKLEIEVYGTITEIKEYSSNINLTGKLRSYKGENTNIDLGELTKTESKFISEYQMPKANVKLRKINSITKEDITGAEFTLYEWNGKEYIEKEKILDSNKDGYYETKYYEWNSTTQGKYKIKETKTEENYKNNVFYMEFEINELRTQDYTIIPDYNDSSYKINYESKPDKLGEIPGVIENEPYKLKVKFHNVDEETNKEIGANAVYKIYQWNKDTMQYEEYMSYTKDDIVKIIRQGDKTYLTEEWLYYTNTNKGKYRIIEETAANGYYGDYVPGTTEKRIYDINILEQGKYYDQEIKNEGTLEIFNNEDGNIKSIPIKTGINVQLIDNESKKNIGQGDATLEGAKFGIYAKKQINHPDGETTRYEGEPGVLYKEGELVKIVTTDDKGKFTVNDLKCGEYFIKEIETSKGYVLNETEFDIDFNYQGEETKEITKDLIIEKTIIKQGIQMLKLSQETNDPLQNVGFKVYLISNLKIVTEGKISKNSDGTYTLNDETAQKDSAITRKANENGTYEIGDLINYYYKIGNKTENNMQAIPQGKGVYYPYNMAKEKTASYYENYENKTLEELFSNEEGYIKTPELPYGEYILIETSVPNNYETVKPFKIEIINDSRELQNMKYVYDPNFESKVKIYFTDVRTKQNILKEGTKFVIQNTETGELVTYNNSEEQIGTIEKPFEASKDGIYISPMALQVGKYEVKQVQIADGYVIKGKEGYSENGELKQEPSTSVKFEIGTNQLYYVDSFEESNVVVLKEENKEQLATIKVEVQGEYIKEIQRVNEDEVEVKYENKLLNGVKIGLYARENIYTQDNQGGIVHLKDELVREGITNEEGIVYFENIEIGKYYIKEINTIQGFIPIKENIDVDYNYGVNNENIGEDKWKEEAQETPIVWINKNIIEQRQKVKIEIENKDIDGKEIEGTKYGIYASEDITNKDGEVIIKAGELLKTEITNQEGKASFDIDLPLGKYQIKELDIKDGYLKNNEIKEIDATYNPSEGETINRKVIFENDYIKVKINIIDGKTEEPVKGVELKITDSDGNEVSKYEIKDDDDLENIISKLPPGKYTVESTKMPEQYKKIEAEIEILEKDGVQIYNLKAEYATFDLKIQKWTSQIILLENNKQVINLTQIDPDKDTNKIMKVELGNKRIESTVVKFVYTIRVTNVGKIPGYATEIEDIIPKSLEFIKSENKNWKEINGTIKTNELENQLLKPGEYADVDIVLKWKNGSENIGAKKNKAALTKATNEYGIEEVADNNESWSTVLISVATGEDDRKTYVIVGIIATNIMALGIELIRKYIL